MIPETFTCSGCGRRYDTAPWVANDRGMFCWGCEAAAFAWESTPQAEVPPRRASRPRIWRTPAHVPVK